VAAQFSEHPVTEWHRDAAVRALETGLANIRAAMPAPATEPEPIAASA
jgi:hypothetical protein